MKNETLATNSKTRYFLIEIVVNCLVFAIAASICLNLFVSGYIKSHDSRDLSLASLEAQSMAEIIKSANGDMEIVAELVGAEAKGGELLVYYDGDWNIASSETAEFTMTINTTLEASLVRSQISVADLEGVIFELPVVKYIESGVGA